MPDSYDQGGPTIRGDRCGPPQSSLDNVTAPAHRPTHGSGKLCNQPPIHQGNVPAGDLYSSHRTAGDRG